MPRPDDRPRPDRRDGYVPIEDYVAIGDGRTVALIARDGSIDWWPAPDVNSDPLVARLVDAERGGSVVLRPVDDDFEVRRRYVPGTIVAETTFTTATGEVRVTDSLDVGLTGRLPWTELARRAECTRGSVRLAWEVRPGTNFGLRSPWTTSHDGMSLVHAGSLHMCVATSDNLGCERGQHGVSGEADLGEGERATLAVVVTDASPVPVATPEEVEVRAERTIAGWEEWSAALTCGGDWGEALRRSALTLKMLLFAPGGAIVAAPTTSLPERVGGIKNWDYRFAWVRDSVFTLDALIRLGLHEEVHGAMSWLLRAVRNSDPQLAIYYTVHGDVPGGETILDAPGWRGNGPVRRGNRASVQQQFGTFGDLFDALGLYVDRGYVLDPETGRLLERFADWCCDSWANPDAGMWELVERRHYTVSKMGCWTALDRAVRLADGDHVPGRHVERWQAERDEIRAWIDEHCWSERRRAYTWYAGTDDLDAAVLLAGRFGFDRSERLDSTIDAVRAELGRGPLLHRFTGAQAEEGAFVACSFWMADALVRVGRRDEAREVIDEMLELANDVGLYGEMIDPADGSFLGNFPQGLSHLALIDAIFAYREAEAKGTGAP